MFIVLSEAINLEMNAHDKKRNQMFFYGYKQTDDTSSPVARSLQLIQ
jgi:hypothetical protein